VWARRCIERIDGGVIQVCRAVLQLYNAVYDVAQVSSFLSEQAYGFFYIFADTEQNKYNFAWAFLQRKSSIKA